ncbi:type II secretion system F family protein [Endozoicomonas sp.]|uniref:type II secretion system F family protein n=1 Tax=Endozoicomonas sp. TaxID=1892382 RepID=UPI003AF505D0
MSDSLSLLLAMTFMAVFMVSIGILLLGPRHRIQRRLHHYLEMVGGDQPVHQALRKRYVDQLHPWLQRIEHFHFVAELDLLTLQAGKGNRALELLVSCLAMLLISGVVLISLDVYWVLALVSSVLLALLPVGYLQRVKERRITEFDQQMPDWLDMMVKGLKAGLPLVEAMNLSARELGDPMAAELSETVQDIEFSKDMKHAFLAMVERVPSEPLLMVVSAILLQHETGGSLLELLSGLRGQIRERIGFDRRLQTLSAEGRMSAWILVLLPFILAVVINMVSPGYLNPLLESDTGLTILMVAGVMMVLGIFWVVRLIRIQV